MYVFDPFGSKCGLTIFSHLLTTDPSIARVTQKVSQPGRKAADSEQRIRPTTPRHAGPSGRRADSLFRIRRFTARLAKSTTSVAISCQLVSWSAGQLVGQCAVCSAQLPFSFWAPTSPARTPGSKGSLHPGHSGSARFSRRSAGFAAFEVQCCRGDQASCSCVPPQSGN